MLEDSAALDAEKFGDNANALFDTMEVWPVGIAAVMPNGVFRFANQAARELLCDFCQTRVNFHGELIVRSGAELLDAIGSRRTSIALEASEPVVKIGNIALFFGADNGDTLLLATQKKAAAEARCSPKRFGLTTAESAVLSAIINGDSVDAIAVKRGTSQHTIRSQLKSIFRKTKTHRQSELVRLFVDF